MKLKYYLRGLGIGIIITTIVLMIAGVGHQTELTDEGIACWHAPKGGYFVCVAALSGTAKRALELCKDLGVKLTEAGATYPYGVDPQDSVIRIAPSLPPIEELEKAMEVFCVCLKIAALEKYLGVELA